MRITVVFKSNSVQMKLKERQLLNVFGYLFHFFIIDVFFWQRNTTSCKYNSYDRTHTASIKKARLH